MTIAERVEKDLRDAMFSKDKILVEVLRSIKTELVNISKEKGGDGTVTEEKAISKLQNMVKKRKESAEIFAANSRPDLEKIELLQIDIIVKYLPAQMTKAEMRKQILLTIADTGVSKIEQLGVLKKEVITRLKSKADGKTLSEMTNKLFLAYLETKK